MKKPTKRLLLLASIQGGATLGGIFALNLLPAGPTVSEVQECLLLPGALAASLVWPEGLESNSAGSWLLLALAGNYLFYSLLWLVALTAVRRAVRTT